MASILGGKPSEQKDKSLSQHALAGTSPNIGKKTSRKIADPLGLWKSKPKAPEATAEEVALGIRQRKELDKETALSESKLKAMARGTLGRQSLLTGGTPDEGSVSRSRGGRGGRGGAGSLLGGFSGGGASGGGSRGRSGIDGQRYK